MLVPKTLSRHTSCDVACLVFNAIYDHVPEHVHFAEFLTSADECAAAHLSSSTSKPQAATDNAALALGDSPLQ